MKNIDRRLWILFVAGVLIVAASYDKMARQERERQSAPTGEVSDRQATRPAPLFEAFNQENQIVRAGAFIGRHEIWLVFFHDPLDRDRLFQSVLSVAEVVQADGIKIIGITPALPQVNRKLLETMNGSTIPILTDPEPVYTLHKQWGLVDEQTGNVR
ncbi:MAG: hypothetical protein O2955_16710, partial [Planctomycetota bacterium]|nr:hypothetical protein [Planctomycetota bacterium]